MLENRDYMRAPSFEPRRPVTITLLIVIVVASELLSAWLRNRIARAIA